VPAEHSGVNARGVTVRVADKLLLRGIDLDVAPGELCAVIGVSGSGKSTLLRVLAGVDSPTLGHVAVDGAPAIQRTHLVGYVPFGDLVHPQLTVREALGYAAALRLPVASETERDARVEDVIRELRMEERADSLVGSLSDGERRRVACGSELVGSPRALVLDEPTTGLDPDLQRRLMLFLRGLADRGLAVVLSTHATGSLDLCDQIAVMAPGGTVRFTGSQAEVLAHFGEQTIDDVYDDVHTKAEDEPVEVRPKAPAPPDAEMPPLPPLGRQVATLTSRYATCMRRQRRSLTILLGQAPIIGLAIALVLPTTAGRTVDLTPFYTLLIAFTVVIGSIWMGLISACREIAGETAILRRETAVGVRIDAYLLSKCAVLLPIAAAQVGLLLAPLILIQPLGTPPGDYLLAAPVLVAAGFTGSMLGLLISASVRTAGQATTAVPVVMIPQLLFSGALIARAAMAPPMQLISDLMPSRWTLSSVGTAFDLDQLVQGNLGGITGLEASFFDISPVVGLGILGAASVALYVITGVVLSWRLGDDSPGRLASGD
jgi:ABC-type multidrug transport system ATPase subunit/ABC-type multidrug transport system permease subunit